jgi:hypothetical protein
MSVEVLAHLVVDAIFVSYTYNVLLNELQGACILFELLKLRTRNFTLWTLCWWLSTFVDISTNGTNEFLFHNVLDSFLDK